MKRWPLWLVTTLGLILATSVVSVVGTTLMRRADSHTFFELFQRQNENLMKMLVAATREALISEDAPLLESVLNDIRDDNEDLLLVRVFNEDEQPLVLWNGSGDESKLYILGQDVTMQGEKFGRVEVGWKSDWIASRVESYAGRLLYFLVFVLVVLAGIIIFLIHLLVVRPIRDMDRRLTGVVDPKAADANPLISSLELHRLSESVNRFHSLLRQKEEATHELVQSEALKAAVLSSSFDGIITIDEHSKIVEFNPASERMFGYSREEAINQDITELIIPPKLRGTYKQRVKRYLAGGSRRLFGSRMEIDAQRRSGDLFSRRNCGYPI